MPRSSPIEVDLVEAVAADTMSCRSAACSMTSSKTKSPFDDQVRDTFSAETLREFLGS